MRELRVRRVLVAAALALGLTVIFVAQTTPQNQRNIIIFVADGMRNGSINAVDAPTLMSVRARGVNFANSHSVFPSLTMPNAAAIATGYSPGDTGQFSNRIFTGHPLYTSGNFALSPGTMTPNVENDRVLGDVAGQFGGNYLATETLLSLARNQGYSTAAVGKVGPTAIQDLTELAPSNGAFRTPTTVILDDSTGRPEGIPLRPDVIAGLAAAKLGTSPPARNQSAGTNSTPGALAPNTAHQQWLVDAVTKAVLPLFRERGKPFMLLFWSGDPDQTEHAQGDSLNTLVPGVNGTTSKAAVRNADDNFKQILDYINGNPALGDTTDIFVTADHGFSTVSRHAVDAEGHVTKSYSATFTYKDNTGRQDVNTGFLPNGFLAIDLAHALNLPLYDADSQVTDARGIRVYSPVDPTLPRPSAAIRQRPSGENGLLGGTGRISTPTDAKVIVADNSIYVPDNSVALVRAIVQFLTGQDYVGGIFVNDAFRQIPGALPMSAIGLIGSAKLPKPAIMVSARSFSTDPHNPLMTAVIVGGTQQQGQGNHGSLSRANTFNNMAAIGPDFKKQFVDAAPIGNVDMAPTLASLMGIKLSDKGSLRGRVLKEALAGNPENVRYESRVMRSSPTASGWSTVLMYQEIGRQRYLDEACFTNNATCGSLPR